MPSSLRIAVCLVPPLDSFPLLLTASSQTSSSLRRSPMWRDEMECAVKMHDCRNSVRGSGLEKDSRALKGRAQRNNNTKQIGHKPCSGIGQSLIYGALHALSCRNSIHWNRTVFLSLITTVVSYICIVEVRWPEQLYSMLGNKIGLTTTPHHTWCLEERVRRRSRSRLKLALPNGGI